MNASHACLLCYVRLCKLPYTGIQPTKGICSWQQSAPLICGSISITVTAGVEAELCRIKAVSQYMDSVIGNALLYTLPLNNCTQHWKQLTSDYSQTLTTCTNSSWKRSLLAVLLVATLTCEGDAARQPVVQLWWLHCLATHCTVCSFWQTPLTLSLPYTYVDMAWGKDRFWNLNLWLRYLPTL